MHNSTSERVGSLSERLSHLQSLQLARLLDNSLYMNFRQILRRMIILFRSKADFRSKHRRTNNTLICLPKCEQLELTVVYRVCKKQMKTITHIVRL